MVKQTPTKKAKNSTAHFKPTTSTVDTPMSNGNTQQHIWYGSTAHIARVVSLRERRKHREVTSE